MPIRARAHNPYVKPIRAQLQDQADAREADRQAGRLSAHQRGYTRRWLAASRDYRRRNPWCARHLELGKVVPGTQTDHVIPHKGDPGLFWNEDNWQNLCSHCHGIKTATEDGGYGHPVVPRPPRPAGAT